MDEVIEILKTFRAGVDFSTAEGIVSNHIINSIDITEMISDIEDTFDIEIGMEYMENENFDTVEAIWNMVQKIKAES